MENLDDEIVAAFNKNLGHKSLTTFGIPPITRLDLTDGQDPIACLEGHDTCCQIAPYDNAMATGPSFMQRREVGACQVENGAGSS